MAESRERPRPRPRFEPPPAIVLTDGPVRSGRRFAQGLAGLRAQSAELEHAARLLYDRFAEQPITPTMRQSLREYARSMGLDAELDPESGFVNVRPLPTRAGVQGYAPPVPAAVQFQNRVLQLEELRNAPPTEPAPRRSSLDRLLNIEITPIASARLGESVVDRVYAPFRQMGRAMAQVSSAMQAAFMAGLEPAREYAALIERLARETPLSTAQAAAALADLQAQGRSFRDVSVGYRAEWQSASAADIIADVVAAATGAPAQARPQTLSVPDYPATPLRYHDDQAEQLPTTIEIEGPAGRFDFEPDVLEQIAPAPPWARKLEIDARGRQLKRLSRKWARRELAELQARLSPPAIAKPGPLPALELEPDPGPSCPLLERSA